MPITPEFDLNVYDDVHITFAEARSYIDELGSISKKLSDSCYDTVAVLRDCNNRIHVKVNDDVQRIVADAINNIEEVRGNMTSLRNTAYRLIDRLQNFRRSF